MHIAPPCRLVPPLLILVSTFVSSSSTNVFWWVDQPATGAQLLPERTIRIEHILRTCFGNIPAATGNLPGRESRRQPTSSDITCPVPLSQGTHLVLKLSAPPSAVPYQANEVRLTLRGLGEALTVACEAGRGKGRRGA